MVGEPPASKPGSVSALPMASRPRVVMLVSNPCINDTRVIRAAETASMGGFDTVVLALSNDGETSEERRNGVFYRRLANPRLIPARNFFTATTVDLANIPTYELVNILLQLKTRPSKSLAPASLNQVGVFRLTGEICRLLVIRSVMLTRAIALKACHPIRPMLEAHFMRKIFESEALKLAPSIIHAHDLVTLPAGAAIAERCGARLIYDAHELEVHRNTKAARLSQPIRAYLERKHIRQCDAVITVCDSIADHLAEQYAVDRPFVVMNAPNLEEGHQSDKDLRSSLKLSSNTPLAVYVGRITTGRGIEQCIRALAYLPEYHLALVGPTHGPTEEAAQNLARTLGVFDRLHFVPPVAPNTVISFVSSADVSVVPIQNVCLSYYYCLPNKLLESTFAGLPVVVSNFPELRRFVELSGSGLVMDETDPHNIANTIREAYEKRRQLMPSDEALARVEQIYGWPTQKKNLDAIYASFRLLSENGPPGVIKH